MPFRADRILGQMDDPSGRSCVKRRQSTAIFAVISGCLAVVLALTGCSWLLFGNPCGMYGCPDEEIVSVPPRDNPLSRALATPVPAHDLAKHLNGVVWAEYEALGRRWPSPAQCESIPSEGCRYVFVVRYAKYMTRTCYQAAFVVSEADTTYGPVVRSTIPPIRGHVRCS